VFRFGADMSGAPKVLHSPVLYNLRLLEEMNDLQYLLDILYMLLTYTPGQLRELMEATARQDFERIHYLSHKLKGSLGVLQCTTLDGLLSQIEKHAKERRDTTAMMQTVIAIYDELKWSLKAELLRRNAPCVNPAYYFTP
jgi:HPt (histidine-containing phosphotransfer) domain-containing protein